MSGQPIAIVGMAGRLPGAATVAAFWQSLLRGEEQVRDCLAPAGVGPDGTSAPANDRFVGRAAVLADVDLFDATFFGVTPQEARLMDPQQRLLLQCAFEACEDAGLVPAELGGRVGVYTSGSLSSYLVNNLLKNRAVAQSLDYPVLLGNDKDFLSTRISYKLNLTGPSVTVQSACSSSLVAVHLACQALGAGECDAALVGGVSVSVPQEVGYHYKEGGILSRDGHCRVFDEGASGTIKGNGCGVVVLKRLDDAVRARDQIYAVIRGSAVRNDGSARAGFTAPSPAGQASTIGAALTAAGIPVSDLGYIEAHGTGTSMGDPIELRALARAHQAAGGPPRRCHLGSVKANIGHLDAAAGVVGLIKTALVLRHNRVPPQINFRALNPAITVDLDSYDIPVTEQSPQPPLAAAAVSSFGLGGTNAHCVLAAPPSRAAAAGPGHADASEGGPYLLALSARTADALRAMATRLADALTTAPEADLRDVAFTLLEGRTRMTQRWGCVATDCQHAITQLRQFAAGAAAPLAPLAAAWIADPTGAADVGDLRGAHKVSLPTYPFARERHWVQPDTEDGSRDAAAPAAAPPPASAPSVEAVIAILEDKLKIAGVGATDDYYALGGDSLTAVDVVTELADRFGVTVSLACFEGLRTASAVTEHLVAALRSSAATKPAVEPRTDVTAPPASGVTPPSAFGVAGAPSGITTGAVISAASAAAPQAELVRAGTGEPVFLFPPAGGTNFCYYQLVRRLACKRPFYVVPFPAEQRDQIPSLRALAERFRHSVSRIQPDGPLTLAGYSFGGNVAFEVALQLQREGRSVPEVMMFDAHPPEAYVGARTSDRDVLTAFPLLLSSLFGGGKQLPQRDAEPPGSIDDLLSSTQLPGHSIAVLGEYRKFFQVWKHNHGALKGYYPDEALQGRLTIFEATEREDRRVLELLRIRPLNKGPWRDHVSGPVRVAKVAGDHYSMFVKPENLAALAATWDRVLAGEDDAALWREPAEDEALCG